MFVVYAHRSRHSAHENRVKAFHIAHALRAGGVMALVVMVQR